MIYIYLFSVDVSGFHVKIALPKSSSSSRIQKRLVQSKACSDYVQVNKTILYLPNGLSNPWESDRVMAVNSTEVTNGMFSFFATTKVPGLGTTTIQQVLDYIVSQGCYCFPFGGLVRDQFLGGTPKDLDMEVSCSSLKFALKCGEAVFAS